MVLVLHLTTHVHALDSVQKNVYPTYILLSYTTALDLQKCNGVHFFEKSIALNKSKQLFWFIFLIEIKKKKISLS